MFFLLKGYFYAALISIKILLAIKISPADFYVFRAKINLRFLREALPDSPEQVRIPLLYALTEHIIPATAVAMCQLSCFPH